MTDTNTTQDAATKAAEEIVSQTGDVPGISTKWLAGVIRRHFPQPVAPESGEFVGHTPIPWRIDWERTENGAPFIVADTCWRKQLRIVAKFLYHSGSEDPEVTANARLAVNAVNERPALLAERDAQKAENDALKAEVARLREIVQRLAKLSQWTHSPECFENPSIATELRALIARAALEGKE